MVFWTVSHSKKHANNEYNTSMPDATTLVAHCLFFLKTFYHYAQRSRNDGLSTTAVIVLSLKTESVLQQ